MSVKAKIAAGTATFALVGGGLGLAGALTASAATPACGNGCTNIFPQKYGPQYQVDVYQARAAANQPVILFQQSNSDPAEDFVVRNEGTVNNYEEYFVTGQTFFSQGFVSNYGDDNLYEFQYEPYGVNSNFCLSTYSNEAPQPGYKVRLERCGQYANSLWASDTGNGGDGFFGEGNDNNGSNEVADARSTADNFAPTGEDVPLINAADSSFSDPLVLNYPAGNPTDMPRPILNVQPESTYSNGTVFDNQEWGGVTPGGNNNTVNPDTRQR